MKLNYARTLTVGLAFFSICSFWQLYDHVIPLMLKFTFNISDTVAGGIMAADNILALFMLPLFGSLSDKTRVKWGRRMPYIVFGSFAACATMMLIPIANQLASLPLFIAGLGLTLFFMATYRSPAVALMPDVTIKPLRSKGNAIINLMGALGGLIILLLTPVLLPSSPVEGDGGVIDYQPNYLPLFLLCMAIMAVSILVMLLRVNEPSLTKKMEEESKALGLNSNDEELSEDVNSGVDLSAKRKRSMLFLLASVALWFMGYNAITTSFSKYCAVQFGLGAGTSAMILVIAQAAAILSYWPVGIIATRIGRKKVILGGVLLLGASFAIGSTFHSFTPAIYPIFITAGIAWAAINVNSYPMVVEMARDADVGRFTGFYYTASMSAQTITPILSGASLEYIGYTSLFPYGAFFVFASFVTMLFVRHGDAKPIAPNSTLELYDSE